MNKKLKRGTAPETAARTAIAPENTKPKTKKKDEDTPAVPVPVPEPTKSPKAGVQSVATQEHPSSMAKLMDEFRGKKIGEDDLRRIENMLRAEAECDFMMPDTRLMSFVAGHGLMYCSTLDPSQSDMGCKCVVSSHFALPNQDGTVVWENSFKVRLEDTDSVVLLERIRRVVDDLIPCCIEGFILYRVFLDESCMSCILGLFEEDIKAIRGPVATDIASPFKSEARVNSQLSALLKKIRAENSSESES